jgi:putative transposase
MYLNEMGRIASDEWLHTQEVRDNIVLHEYIIMPDHLHGIIEIQYPKVVNAAVGTFQSPSQTIGAIVRGYKIATIKRIKELLYKGGGKGELQFAPTSAPTYASTSAPAELLDSKGELQFAPTNAPTKIWQRNYYEHIIRTEAAYRNISRYIINNPRRWSEGRKERVRP